MDVLQLMCHFYVGRRFKSTFKCNQMVFKLKIPVKSVSRKAFLSSIGLKSVKFLYQMLCP